MNVLKCNMVIFGFILLTGCQAPMSDMMNNNFVTITAEPVPEGLVGPWTGNMGPYLVTMKWNSNGYGSFCYSYGTANVLQKLKFSKGELYVQDGTRLILKELNSNSIKLYAPYAAGEDSVLFDDKDYANASEYCAGLLSN